MKKISYLLCILLVAICLTGCNDKKENTTPNIDDVKELTPQEKYDKAMTLLESDEKSAIEILREIPDYKDVKTYIDNYDFKHRFDGTWFIYHNDKRTESETSHRIIINGLNKDTKLLHYTYNLDDIRLNGNTYHKGRFNDYTTNIQCNDTLDICTTYFLTSTNDNGLYQETVDKNHKDLYRIDTYIFSDDTITKTIHYVKKKYNFDNDFEVKYAKLNDSIEMPPEREETERPKEPQIGMTKEEVERSTWGYPNKINKDTYSWGTREQWVYDKGYIYFRDDVVTSISER